jgi:nicotinamidase-related amidase
MSTLPFGPLPAGTVHLCVDMQNVFIQDTEWHVPWMKIILPSVVELSARLADRTIFTRFVPPDTAEQAPGAWQRYYSRWPRYTVDAAGTPLLQIVPELAALNPPAVVVDKSTYSAFSSRELVRRLRAGQVECLIVTGVETDVCVLATVLAAIDHGFRVIVPLDGVCSSTDRGHDSLIGQYQSRFSQQLETSTIETILALWQERETTLPK